MVQLLLIGDSDIKLWPQDLLPDLESLRCNYSCEASVDVRGFYGATLVQVVSKFQEVASNGITAASLKGNPRESLVVVGCAGENDLGNGTALHGIVEALQTFLNVALSIEERTGGQVLLHGVVFLGPKFEPWMEADPSSKKGYSKLSRAFARCCSKHIYADRIHFLDCLTLFCGDTAELPGATVAGRACADDGYFAMDHLHLNREGYKVLKKKVEDALRHKFPLLEVSTPAMM